MMSALLTYKVSPPPKVSVWSWLLSRRWESAHSSYKVFVIPLSLSVSPSFLSLSLPLQERYLVFFLHASVLHPHTTTYMYVHIMLSGSTYGVYGKMGSVPCVHVAGSTWVEGKALGQCPSVH